MNDPLERALEASRRARADGDGEACRAALKTAQAIASESEDPSRIAQVAWRRAKAEFDFGDAAGIAAALGPVLPLEDPFAGSDAALSATEALCRRMRDEAGYEDSLPDDLLISAAQAWRVREDPVRALWVDVQRAWSLACRGELDALALLTSQADRLRTRDVVHSQFRHARADSTGGSLAWMQLDLWRASLRAATWTENPSAMRRALDGIEDAAEDAGLRRLADPWFLEAVVNAEWQLGRVPTHGYPQALSRCLERVEGERGLLHRKLYAAWSSFTQQPDADRFVAAAELAAIANAGPEWEAWAWRGAERAGLHEAATRVSELVRSRGVLAFAASAR